MGKRAKPKAKRPWQYSVRRTEPTKAQAQQLQSERELKNRIFELEQKIAWWESSSAAREQHHRDTVTEYLRRSLVRKPTDQQLTALSVICGLSMADCEDMGITHEVATLNSWRLLLKERDVKQMELPLAETKCQTAIPMLDGVPWQPVAQDHPPERTLVRDGKRGS